jgi:Raf kinase inhibitor-like YbhB/YbcL family protein
LRRRARETTRSCQELGLCEYRHSGAQQHIDGRESTMGFALSDLKIESQVFRSNGPIPRKHTGEAEDVSPPLTWSNLPAGTKSLALVCHDPDAPLVTAGTYGFVHWVLYDIPATVAELPEGVQGFTSGINSFGKTGYGGPMPPPGHGVHHYFFWLLALDAELDLEPELSMWALLERIEPHVIGMNRLVGTYSRG